MIVAAAVVRAFAAQLAIVAHGPATAAACEPVEISVAVSAAGTVAPRVLMPPLGPFELLRTSAKPTVSLDREGDPKILVEHKYVVTTDQVGTFTLPPFEAHSGGSVVRSRPVHIEIQPGREDGHVPTVVTRAQIDTSLDVNFRALAMPETVFVGQQANYEVAVFLSEAVRDRLRRNPTFFPPDMQSMLAYDLPVAKGEPPRRRVGRRCFDALVYQRAVFPLMPGRFVVPPAQLVYSLSLTPSFFSREETHELRTDSAVIVAVEPPAAFRPPDYTGAVGSLRVHARVDTADGRVGDPLTLAVRVEGSGNVKLFPRPSISVPWATLVPGEERVTVDTTARRIGGSKDFEWILTPHRSGELELPPVRYTFFNPDGRRYETATSRALRLSIAPGLAAADTAITERPLAIRTTYRGPIAPPLYSHAEYWLLLAVAPLPALIFGTRRTSHARAPVVNRRRELRVAAAGRRTTDPRSLRRAFALALAERLAVHPDVFSRDAGLIRMLRHAGVSAPLATEAERFFRALDQAAYAADSRLPDEAGRRALELYRRIDREAVSAWELPMLRRFVLVIAIAGSAVPLSAAARSASPELFRAGVAAYERRDYATAERAFAAVANAEPRAADAWANYGTAAWSARDTARAVLGWQRALRLEPLASDVRARLAVMRDETLASAGFVAPVTLGALAVSFAIAWWSMWVAIAVRARRRDGSHRPALLLGGIATAIGLLSVHQVERLSGRDLAVVQLAGPVVVSPALGADRVTTADVGDVARVRALHGVWSRIALDGGRHGWIETAKLLSLASPSFD